jgi:hypothetical protein
MTQREIANLCCRVLAVFVLVQGLREFPALAHFLLPLSEGFSYSTPAVIYRLMQAARPLVLCAAGLFLWKWSYVVAAWMAGHDLQDAPDEREIAPTAATRSEIHAIAFSTLGLWVLTQSVPLGLGYAAQIALVGWSGRGTDDQNQWWTLAVIEVLVRTIIGLYLLFGASGLVNVLRRGRGVGLEKAQRPEYPAKDTSAK